MIGLKKATLCVALFAAIGLWALPAVAGLLDTGTPYSGGGRETWKGTTIFPDSVDPYLDGTVDWAVFAPGNFPFSGYTPTPGEFTYAYQIHCTGSAAISNFSVVL